MFVTCGIWCLADVSSVSPSSEQTDLNLCLNNRLKLSNRPFQPVLVLYGIGCSPSTGFYLYHENGSRLCVVPDGIDCLREGKCRWRHRHRAELAIVLETFAPTTKQIGIFQWIMQIDAAGRSSLAAVYY